MRSAKPPVRVLIVDPSPETRAALRRCVEAGAGLQVAGAAATAEQASDMAARAMADVILLGDRPPRFDATAWVRHIMHVSPLPIVIATPGASAGKGVRAFDLMEAGALAVVREPPESPAADRIHATANMLQALALMAEVKVVRRWRRLAATESTAVAVPARAVPAPQPVRRRASLVAIGASTGGPVVLKTILAGLPRSFPVPILIVQHISDGFVDGLAEWLTVSGMIPTHLAGNGQALKPGHAYLAPDGAHMRLTADGLLAFDRTDPVKGHRPAISCLFRSVAEHRGSSAVGILLTGMGTDGSAELKQMRDAGAITIAQDRASSVVHGMAGEAIRCGGAVHVMSPQQIAAALPALVA